MTRPASSLSLFVLCLLFTHNAISQVNVTTYHNDNARTGQNTQETTLTTSNVVFSQFGKLFSVNVDGQVYAQPLVLSNVSIGGGTHNVVYVATENDSVYALDANTGTQYWKQTLGTPVPSSEMPGGGCTNISPIYGITSTPVIDATGGTLYVVAQTTLNEEPSYQLHALDVKTGLEKFSGPATIGGSYAGIAFDATQEMIRPALLLENGHVVFGAGSHCDQGNWFGWVLSYNATTLAQEAIFNTEPSGHCAGVWMSGNGVAADSSGNLYFATGNSEEFIYPNLGDSIVKLSAPPNSFSVLSYFTPSDAPSYGDNGADTDVGSGGVLLLPGTDLLAQIGKSGVLYLVNQNSMGGYCSNCDGNDTNIVQEIDGASAGLWGSPAYWNGHLYFGSAAENGSGPLHAYSFNASGKPPLTGPLWSTSQSYNWPAPTPSVSSNGTSNGIVWFLDNSDFTFCCAVLHAFEATSAVELYNSNQLPTRDQAGYAVKFSVPTVANGKVYVGGGAYSNSGQLTAYGLVPPSAVLSPTNWTIEGTTSLPPQSQTFTLTNASPSTLTITSIQTKALTGTDYFGISGQTCGGSLAAKASCTITLSFFPSQVGSFLGELVVTDSAPKSPQTASLFAKILP